MKKKYVRFEYKIMKYSSHDAISTSVTGTDNGKNDLNWQTAVESLTSSVDSDV